MFYNPLFMGIKASPTPKQRFRKYITFSFKFKKSSLNPNYNDTGSESMK